MVSETDFKKVLSSLQARCARTEYCSADIRRKALKAFDGDAQAAEAAVSSLLADGFVDDGRYAAAFAREKSRLTGWGPVKIAFQLRGKGIDDALVRQALEQIDADKATARLRSLLEAKYKSVQGEPDARLRLIRFALGRGYDYERVSEALKGIL